METKKVAAGAGLLLATVVGAVKGPEYYEMSELGKLIPIREATRAEEDVGLAPGLKTYMCDQEKVSIEDCVRYMRWENGTDKGTRVKVF